MGQSYQAPPQQPFQAQAPPQYQAPQPQIRPYQPPPGGMPPQKKGMSTVAIVFMVIGGLVLIGIIGVAVVVSVFVHKVKQAGFDPELMKRNPGLAISKMVTAFNPDVEVLNTDDRAGTITVRDRKTGKVVTLRFDDVRNGRFNMNIQEDGKNASISVGGDAAGKVPSWVPVYPGGKVNGAFAATSTDEHGDAGTFTFTTNDSAAEVRKFYEDKAKETGMVIDASGETVLGTALKINDANSKRNYAIVIMGTGPTTVQVSYATQ